VNLKPKTKNFSQEKKEKKLGGGKNGGGGAKNLKNKPKKRNTCRGGPNQLGRGKKLSAGQG